jgi:serine/threonine protein kinase
MRKRIVRELQIMHGCHSDYIVTFYGAFLNENNDVIMCMEYMDVGCVTSQRTAVWSELTGLETALSTVSRGCLGPSG